MEKSLSSIVMDMLTHFDANDLLDSGQIRVCQISDRHDFCLPELVCSCTTDCK